MQLKYRNKRRGIAFLLVCFVLVFCSAFDVEAKRSEKDIEEEVEEILSGMTQKEKIGQLFMVTPNALGAQTKVTAAMKTKYKKYPVGGIILMGANISTPAQLKKFTKNIQKLTPIDAPILIATDEEGGRVARIGQKRNFSVTRYPDMRTIGNSGSTKKAMKAAEGIGAYLKKYGINCDLAPVADIYSNPKNTVIGNRAFGTNAKVVSKMVKAQVKGFHKKKILCCLKHFPGHGNTKGDSHKGSVSVNKTWKAMKKQEIKPFQAGIDAGVDMVMVAHISCKKVTKSKVPATLSYKMITGKLRKELGFNGVVITDSMAMGAISNHYSSSQAAVKAIKAGADIVLSPVDLKTAFRGVEKAVKNGTITQEELDEHVRRILRMKLKYK